MSNKKLAKQIRKELRYHPRMERQYVWETRKSVKPQKGGGVIETKAYVLVLADSDPRALYKGMKNEAKGRLSDQVAI